MNLDKYSKTLRGAIQENKLGRWALVLLSIANVILVLGVTSKDTAVVVVPPTLSSQGGTLASNSANASLKEAWGSYFAMMLGNVTPRTADYVAEQLGKYVAPRAYNGFMEKIADQVERIKDDNLTIQFAPTHVFYVPEKDIVVVSGEYSMRGMRSEERRTVRTYEVGIAVNNYNVQISSIRPYEGPWQPTLDEKEALEQKRLRDSRKAASRGDETGAQG